MSRVSLQDSIYPKPHTEGIAEEYPRQPLSFSLFCLWLGDKRGDTSPSLLFSLFLPLSFLFWAVDLTTPSSLALAQP